MTDARETPWRGQPAWELEGPGLRCTVVPGMGAKIVSLVDEDGGGEWLVGPGMRAVRPVDYGALWHEQDMAGWDEMFPTIIACAYPGEGPCYGTQLPDHGEAWSMPWRLDGTGNGLEVTLTGRALPYTLTRRMDIPERGTLRLRYTLHNLQDEYMPYVWASHPQFVMGDEGQVVFPNEVTEVINTIPESWGWGPPETRFGWPDGTGIDGEPVRTDLSGPATLRRGRKFFVLPDLHPSWAAVLRRDTGYWLRLSWDPSQLPYLGLWVDEGSLNHETVATPEPTTGWYDDLALAFAKGKVMTAPPGGTCEWELVVRAGCGDPAPGD